MPMRPTAEEIAAAVIATPTLDGRYRGSAAAPSGANGPKYSEPLSATAASPSGEEASDLT